MVGWDGFAALGLFAGAYVLFAVRERWRLAIAGGAAIVAVAGGLVPLASLPPRGFSAGGSPIEWNTLGLLLGLFLFSLLLRETGFFRWVANRLVRRWGDRPLSLFVALTTASFALSAFLNSITVLLVLATLTIEVARSTGIDPVPLLLGEISAANAGGAATFVGDPPNVILGTSFGYGFTDFLVHTGPAALAALVVIVLLLRRRVPSGPVATPARAPEPPPVDPRRGVALVGFGAVLTVLSLQGALGIPVWLVGVGAGALALAIAGRRYGPAVVRDVDVGTLLFFLALFVLVGALQSTGDLSVVAGGLGSVSGGNVVLAGSLLLWTLGLLSSVVDNVPLAAAAVPMLSALSAKTGVPVKPLVWATALGTDLGGNGTPIGASANVVGLSVADRAGVHVGWRRYVRDAFPVMLASLAAANLVWLVTR